MAFLGYPRGHRIDSETRCCMTVHRMPNECMDTLPRTRASQEPIGRRGMKPGGSPEFCATLKLLAASVVLRRNVPPFSKVSKQWPRSYAPTSDAPSRASCLCPAKPHRNRATALPHSWPGSGSLEDLFHLMVVILIETTNQRKRVLRLMLLDGLRPALENG